MTRWPLLLIACAACGPAPEPPDTAEVVALVPELHTPIYDVYALPLDRDAIWDLLSHSFAGEALTEQYVELWTSRHRMAREETAIDVRRVEYDAIEVLDAEPGLVRVDVAWSVGGIVTHQRHKHPRVNRYRAVYTLADGADGWRIVQTRMKDLFRVKSPSREGGVFDVLDETPDGGGGYLDPLDLLDGGLGEDTGTPGNSDLDLDADSGAAPTTMDPFGALEGP